MIAMPDDIYRSKSRPHAIGHLEKEPCPRLPFDNDDRSAGFISRIFHILKQMLIEDNVSKSFMTIEAKFRNWQNPDGLLSKEDRFRHSQNFIEPWPLGDPKVRLSSGRRGA
jgi:hypothetical protein